MALLTDLAIDDFEQLPDALARNHELVKGELVDVSGNIGSHNGLRDALVEVLSPYVRQNKLGRIVSLTTPARSRRYADQPVPTILTESQDFRPDQIPGFSIRIADLLAMI
jgi:hypothetical protein